MKRWRKEPKVSRFTIDLSGDYDRTLSNLVADKGSSKADIIRKALVTYAALTSEAKPDEGRHVSITKDGEIEKDIILP